MVSPRTDSSGRYKTWTSYSNSDHFIIPGISFKGVPEFEVGGNVFTFTEMGKFSYDSALTNYDSESRELMIIERFWKKLISITNKYREPPSCDLTRDPLLRSFYRAERRMLSHLIDDIWYVFHIHFRYYSDSEEITLGRSPELRLLNDYICHTPTGKDLRHRLRRFTH